MFDKPRVVIVTGGARGIGLAVALRFQQDNYHVVTIDVADGKTDALESEQSPDHAPVHFEQASVTDRDRIASVVGAVHQRWGRIDVLVNNAGINRPGDVVSFRDEDWDAVLGVNLKGAFICSSVVAKVMCAQGSGSIVNISSTAAAGREGSPGYVASKSGLIGLSRRMATELGPFGITVNVVAPGVTRTEWVARHLPQETLEEVTRLTPLRRLGRPADVAGVVAFLASEDARFVTGQVISVSGGQWMP